MEPNKEPPAHNRPRMFVKKGKNREKIETAVVNAELRHVFQFRCYSTLSCPDVVLVDFLVFPVFFFYTTERCESSFQFSFFFPPMPSLSFPASYHRSSFRSFFFQITASFSLSYSACRNLSSLQRVVVPTKCDVPNKTSDFVKRSSTLRASAFCPAATCLCGERYASTFLR